MTCARQRRGWTAATVVAALVVAGTAQAAPAQGKMKLRFAGRWVAGAQDQAYQAFAQAIETYERLNPNVDIEYIGRADTTSSWRNYW